MKNIQVFPNKSVWASDLIFLISRACCCGDCYCRFHLRVPNLQTSCSDLIKWWGTSVVVSVIATRVTYSIVIDNKGLFQYLYGYRCCLSSKAKSHCAGKTVIRPSYLCNGISNTDKMVSIYWNWNSSQEIRLIICRPIVENNDQI